MTSLFARIVSEKLDYPYSSTHYHLSSPHETMVLFPPSSSFLTTENDDSTIPKLSSVADNVTSTLGLPSSVTEIISDTISISNSDSSDSTILSTLPLPRFVRQFVEKFSNCTYNSPYFYQDLPAGFLTGLTIAPFVTSIDRAVVEASADLSKKRTIRYGIFYDNNSGFKLLFKNPIKYIQRKEFILVVGVYTLTFWAANAAVTFSTRENESKNSEKSNSGNTQDGSSETTSVSSSSFLSPDVCRFLATICVNIPGSVLQDRMFTRWFGLIKPRPVPVTTLSLFATRDMMTCLSSFSLPGIIYGTICASEVTSASTAISTTASTASTLSTGVSASTLSVSPLISLPLLTFLLPTFTQCFSSPLHILGLDCYNRPGLPVTERRTFLKDNYIRTTAARIGRIGPAFGLGSNLNMYLRNNFAI